MRSYLILGLCAIPLGCLFGCGQDGSPTAPVAADATAAADSVAPAQADVGGTRAPAAVNKEDQRHPLVVLRTSAGDIKIRLDAEKAPFTVDNFLSYVERGHYNGTVFHQVVDGYMILGGGFTPEKTEKPTRTAIRNEAHNGLKNKRGTIAMARSSDAIDSSTCQFFINVSDNHVLDHKSRESDEYGYCVFGEVVEGMDVADKISKTSVRDQESFEPANTVLIETVRRVR